MKITKKIFIYILCFFSISACNIFTSHYDSIRLHNFTRLKATHLKLFADWTKGSNKTWNNAQINTYCDQGDLDFHQAYEYAASKDNKDKTGQRAVKILWDEFKDNCSLLVEREKLFSTIFTENILPEIMKNYDYAIAGELARVNAPQ